MYVDTPSSDESTGLDGWFDMQRRATPAPLHHQLSRHHRRRLAHHAARRHVEGLNGVDGWFSNAWAKVKPSAVAKKLPTLPSLVWSQVKPSAVAKKLPTLPSLPKPSFVPTALWNLNPMVAAHKVVQTVQQTGFDPRRFMTAARTTLVNAHPYVQLQMKKAAAAQALQAAQGADVAQTVDTQPAYYVDQRGQGAQYAAPVQDMSYAAPAQDMNYASSTPSTELPPAATMSPAYDYSQPTDQPDQAAPVDQSPAYTVDAEPVDANASPVMLSDEPAYDYNAYTPATVSDTTNEDNTMSALPANTSTNPEVDKWTGIVSALVGTWQQKKLVDTNIERLKQGLPPLDVSQTGVGAQVNVNVDPTIKRYMFWGGMGIIGLGVGLLLLKAKRGNYNIRHLRNR